MSKETDNKRLSGIKKIKHKCVTAYKEIIDYMNDYPNDYYAKSIYGDILGRMGRLDEAIEVYNDVIYNNNNKSKKASDNSYLGLAHISILQNKLDEAIGYLNSVSSDYFSEKVPLILGKIYLQEHKYEDTLRVLSELSTENGLRSSNIIRLYRARSYIELHRYEMAIKELRGVDKSIAVEHYRQKNYLLARICYKTDDNIGAIKYINEVENIEGNRGLTFDIKLLKIIVLKKMGMHDDAISICKDIINKNDTRLDYVYTELGNIYRMNSKFDLALDSYMKIENIPQRNIRIGEMFVSMGNYEEAIKHFKKVDIFSKKDAEIVYHNLLVMAFRTGDYDECLNIISKIDTNMLSLKKIKVIERIKETIDLKQKGRLEDFSGLSYSQQQILDYSEEKAIQHIIRNHVVTDNKDRFPKELDIKTLFHNITHILEKKYLSNMTDTDQYEIPISALEDKVDNINDIDKITVVTLPDSKNIITMFPNRVFTNNHQEDELQKDNKPKVKRLSQIDKFYRRYGK